MQSELQMSEEEIAALLAPSSNDTPPPGSRGAPPVANLYEMFAREVLESLPTTRMLVQAKEIAGQVVMAVVTSVPAGARIEGSILLQAAVDGVVIQRLDHLAEVSLNRDDRTYTAWVLPVGAGRGFRIWRHRHGQGDDLKIGGSVSSMGAVQRTQVMRLVPKGNNP